jgi:UDP-N-acetylmuramoyl-tripeptide--D-alanyl-D-alanine ligase
MGNLKSFFKDLIVRLLTDLSIKKIKMHKPFVIGITGNVGKTTTKDYVYNVLSSNSDLDEVRGSAKSYNSEIGIPLTILGEDNKWSNPISWSFLIFKNYLKYFFNKYFKFIYTEKYPKVLVLEVGADGPGNIKHATTMFTPDIVVLTAFAEHPVHLEFFKNRAEFIKEKKYLVDAVSKNGLVIYNADDMDMTKMALESEAKYKISYGKNSKDLRLLTSTFLYDEQGKLLGTKVIFNFENVQYQIDLRGVLGVSHAYAMLSAVAIAISRGIYMDSIIESLENIKYPKSRLRLLEGRGDSTLIDDTYNSSPKAAELALDTLKSMVVKGKKIAVLGHMAELGSDSRELHMNVGKLATESADIIIFSGRHNDWYLEGVRSTRFNMNSLYLAEDSDEVIDIFNSKIHLQSADVVLLKGSQSARIERVVVSLLKSEYDRGEVCRQESEWGNR